MDAEGLSIAIKKNILSCLNKGLLHEKSIVIKKFLRAIIVSFLSLWKSYWRQVYVCLFAFNITSIIII